MENNCSLEQQLSAYKTSLLQERQQLLRQIQELVNRQADVEARIGAADLLLSQFDTDSPTPQPSLLPELESSRMTLATDFAGMKVVEACTAVLMRERRPMKVRELTEAITAGGIRFKSRTPERTVAVLLYRDPSFVRVAPGTFALAESESAREPARRPASRLNEEGAIRGSERVLREKGGPMHVKDILAALKESGFRSNAKRPDAMLSGTLKRSSKFQLLGGDIWDLTVRDQETGR